jgi:hypothetical protein
VWLPVVRDFTGALGVLGELGVMGELGVLGVLGELGVLGVLGATRVPVAPSAIDAGWLVCMVLFKRSGPGRAGGNRTLP